MKPSKRHALILVSLVVAVAGVGGAGTYAYLSDADHTDISFTSGTLEITNSPDTLEFGPDSEENHTATIEVQNDGTLPARSLNWTNLDLDGPNATVVAKALEVLEVRWNESDVDAGVTDRNGNGIVDLHDYADRLNSGDVRLGSLDSEEDAEFSVTVRFDYSQPGITANGMTLEASTEFRGSQQPT